MKKLILGTGLSGLVGSRVVELLEDKYEFVDLSLNTGVDISDYDEVLDKFKTSYTDVVLHMAAKTDVDGCEDDKILGEEGQAWVVNVTGTQNIVDAAKKTNKKVIYISTDFVFDGTKDSYVETDTPDPVNWYAITKYEGEELLIKSGLKYTIVRLAYPYRSKPVGKTDFVNKIIENAKRGLDLPSLTDHVFTPTFIDDIAYALDMLISRNLTGIYHVVGSESLTPYQATEKILEVFNMKGKIVPVTRDDYFRNRAFRPCRLAIKNDKISKLGVRMLGFTEGLSEVKKQLARGV